MDGAAVYLTAVGEAELRYGVAILPEGRRRDALACALDAILREDFEARILPCDSAAAQAYEPRDPDLSARRSVVY